jgi:hypothetical protein
MTGKEQVTILLKIQSDVAEIKVAQDALKRMGTDAKSLFGSISSGAKLALGAAGVGSVAQVMLKAAGAIRQAASAGFEFATTIQSQTVAFTHLTGSLEKASKRVRELSTLARSTNLEFPSLIAASRNLELLTEGALSGEKGLRLIGDAATAAGAPFEQVAQIVGRLHSNLKNGLPVNAETKALRNLGIVSEEARRKLDGLAAAGVVGGDAWAVAARELGKFSGAMDQASQTWDGLKKEMGETLKRNVAEVFGGDAGGITGFVRALAESVGLVVSKAQKEVEAAAKAHKEAMSGIISESMAQIAEKSAAELQSARAKHKKIKADLDAQNYAEAATGTGGVNMDQAKTADALADQIRMLEEDLLKFGETGMKAVYGATSAELRAEREKLIAEIAAIDAAAKAERWVMTGGKSRKEAVGYSAEAAAQKSAATQRIGAIDKAFNAGNAATGAIKKEVAANERAAAAREELNLQQSLAAIADKRASIEADASLAERARNARTIPLLAEENRLLQKKLDKLRTLAAAEPDPSKRLDYDRQIAGTSRQITANNTAAAAAAPRTQKEEMAAAYAGLSDSLGTAAQRAAQAWADASDSIRTSMGGALADMVWRTGFTRDAIKDLGMSIAENFVQVGAQMVADWIFQHTVMEAWSAIFRTKDVAGNAATEGAKTAAASAGAAARVAIKTTEEAAKTAVHVTSETAQTTATVTGSVTRTAANTTEGMGWLAKAAVQAMSAVASIPYVGPILAVAAAAAVIAAGIKLLTGGFREGGYTGAGARDEIAGPVHRGEFVFPADAVRNAGGPANLYALMDALQHADTGDAMLPILAASPAVNVALNAPAPASSGAAQPIAISLHDDRRSSLKWLKTQAGRRVFKTLQRKTAWERGEKT